MKNIYFCEKSAIIKSLAFIIPFAFLACANLYSQRADTPEQHTVEVDNLLERARKAGTDADRETLAKEGLSLARNISYDEGIVRFLPYAVWYPIVYWAFLALTTVRALPHLLRRPAKTAVRWSTARTGSGS